MLGRIALALALAGVAIAATSACLYGGLDPFGIPAAIIGFGVWAEEQG
jgi:uncharacterized membrane protein